MRLPPSARWFSDVAAGEGLKVTNVVRSKHLKVTVQRHDGVERMFTVGVSTSDHRASLNARKLLRDFSKEGP